MYSGPCSCSVKGTVPVAEYPLCARTKAEPLIPVRSAGNRGLPGMPPAAQESSDPDCWQQGSEYQRVSLCHHRSGLPDVLGSPEADAPACWVGSH